MEKFNFESFRFGTVTYYILVDNRSGPAYEYEIHSALEASIWAEDVEMNDDTSSALHLDSRGYLWIGTRNGLNKFDGENFTIYTEADGLSHNRIHDVTENSEGNIVLLTYAGTFRLCF